MIPDRIFLSGFLCYRDPQELSFQGRTVWMLAGPNGSGKSALFDALTYALFGQHRGGKHNARGLIHHQCKSFHVEFDFTLDQLQYRASRSLARHGRSTRQIYQWEASSAADPVTETPAGTWHAVPETHTERGFARWIDSHLALNYETFTASVLLLQGRAENLLSATPAQRHRLLCQIVGLDRVEALEAAARQHLAQAAGTTTSLQQRTDTSPAVTAEYLDALDAQVQELESQRASQAKSLTELTSALDQVRRSQELTALHDQLDRESRQLDRSIAALQQTESTRARKSEIVEQIAQLNKFQESTQQIADCRAEIDGARRQRDALQEELKQLETEIHMAKEQYRELHERRVALQATRTSLAARQTDTQQRHAALSRFFRSRSRLIQVSATLRSATEQLAAYKEQLADAKMRIGSINSVQDARDAARRAAQRAAKCEARVERANELLQRFRTITTQRLVRIVSNHSAPLTSHTKNSDWPLNCAKQSTSGSKPNANSLKLMKPALPSKIITMRWSATASRQASASNIGMCNGKRTRHS